MSLRLIRNSFFLFLVLLSAVTYPTGCAKEYSFEGAPLDTTSLPDSGSTGNSGWLPGCGTCANFGGGQRKWEFKVGSSQFCGASDTAIMNVDRNAFTFFGPSACSRDSGLIISAHFLNEQLTKDLQAVSSSYAAFQYYDKVGRTNMLTSRNGVPFRVIIDQYDHETGRTTGTFLGLGFTEGGRGMEIHSGKFEVVLK